MKNNIFLTVCLLISCVTADMFCLNLTVDNQIEREITVRFCDGKDHCAGVSVQKDSKKKSSVIGGYLKNFNISSYIYGGHYSEPIVVEKTGSSWYLVVNKFNVRDRGQGRALWTYSYKLYSGDKQEETKLVQQGDLEVEIVKY